jgi:hypothetical protein
MRRPPRDLNHAIAKLAAMPGGEQEAVLSLLPADLRGRALDLVRNSPSGFSNVPDGQLPQWLATRLMPPSGGTIRMTARAGAELKMSLERFGLPAQSPVGTSLLAKIAGVFR